MYSCHSYTLTERSLGTPSASVSCDLGCIAGIVLAILVVIAAGIIIAVVVVYVLYKNLCGPATKLAKTDREGLNG